MGEHGLPHDRVGRVEVGLPAGRQYFTFRRKNRRRHLPTVALASRRGNASGARWLDGHRGEQSAGTPLPVIRGCSTRSARRTSSITRRVVLYGVRAATWKGTEFCGIATPEGEVSVEPAHMFRITDGLISEHWAVRDDLGMMQQLGAL
ncbi:ester cyclase [Kribbella sp. NPDC056345]|uniref:ester cyclase n=1 Tax=Kribbella sp. NPDC056345 TaxID=3345789 RepID=UPI0035DC737A